ncbi:MAG TPA: NAD-dependent epimerase/dehydratase family protein [Gemmatimonadales bacterium]|nr:NAD-dependent epimerase/dehydratase family protein [Candidatus Bathyarchaeia archaeon]HUL04305.1 NAD-dependent epimerase/dehydratase family protein [Gemmatimonadales bacterium]
MVADAHYRERRALITGGLGFIGSNMAKRLVDLGAHVVLVDSLVPEHGGRLFNIDAIKDRVTVELADMRDERRMGELVEGQDYLFNLAGQTSHIDSMRFPQQDLEMNCRAQLSLLEACRHRNPEVRIVFASTRQIYGIPDYLPVDEKHPPRPVDVNGVHKMAGESYHLLYQHVYGLRASALRLTNTIGPRMRIKDARQTFVGLWIRRLLQGEPIEVWDGGQRRDFTYVDDAVEAFLLAGTSDDAVGRVFNVGGANPVTLREVAELLVTLNRRGEYIVRSFPPEYKRIDIGDYYSDCGFIRSALGWTARTSLGDAFACTLDFYREHLERYL